jgi:hypothetical protein
MSMTEEEELEWMISRHLPDMASLPQGGGPTTSCSRGPSRKCSPSTAHPRSKSRGEGKSKERLKEKLKEKPKEKSKENSKSKSKAMTSRQVKAKAWKSKKIVGSEDEDDEVEDEVMEHPDG